ncbi:MAG: hypothetical protein IJ886_00205 [Prevotella sp.]|nr:hypothetical protein [Prevotella sp.]
MGTLKSRKEETWYRQADRTASGRSASEVVLQSLGINGGGIPASTYLLSYDTQGIPTTVSLQTRSFRYGQSATTSNFLRGIFHRPTGDGRCGRLLSGQWRADCCQRPC